MQGVGGLNIRYLNRKYSSEPLAQRPGKGEYKSGGDLLPGRVDVQRCSELLVDKSERDTGVSVRG